MLQTFPRVAQFLIFLSIEPNPYFQQSLHYSLSSVTFLLNSHLTFPHRLFLGSCWVRSMKCHPPLVFAHWVPDWSSCAGRLWNVCVSQWGATEDWKTPSSSGSILSHLLIAWVIPAPWRRVPLPLHLLKLPPTDCVRVGQFWSPVHASFFVAYC